ncbi:hypothetical protein QTP88_026505 [Uroleucon formosanum]
MLTNQGEVVIVRKPIFYTDSTLLQLERDSNGTQAGPAYDRTELMYSWRQMILVFKGIGLRTADLGKNCIAVFEIWSMPGALRFGRFYNFLYRTCGCEAVRIWWLVGTYEQDSTVDTMVLDRYWRAVSIFSEISV